MGNLIGVPVPAPQTRLSNDIVHLTIEKMLFTKLEGEDMIDLTTDNIYTRFMNFNSFNFNAMLAQFAKMERIEIDRNKIFLFRDEGYTGNLGLTTDVSTVIEPFVPGTAFWEPGVFYMVTGDLVSSLIHYKKLCPSVVHTSKFLTDKEPVKISLEGKKSLEVFSALFLGKVIDDPGEYDLQIKKLQLFEEPKATARHFEAILALNSEEIEFAHAIGIYNIQQLPFQGNVGPICEDGAHLRTKKIVYLISLIVGASLDFGNLTQFWASLIPFLAKVCPKLEIMEYKILLNFTSASDDFLNGLEHLVQAVQAIINNLAGGSPQLKIRLKIQPQLEAACYQSLPLNNHALFKLGTAVTVDKVNTPYTARVIKVEDKSGREHEIALQLLQIPGIDEYYIYSEEEEEKMGIGNA